jgi:hypothetical protein
MNYDNYDSARYAELNQRYASGANWFYWIAGLTIITSLIAFFGGGLRFLFSLGITQIIDGVGEAISLEVSGAAKIVALVLDLLVTGLFVGLGWLANRKMLGAYIFGMVAFMLDGLLSLLVADWLSVLAHGFVIFYLIRGFIAGRDLAVLEKSTSSQPTPQVEPAI